MPRILRRPPELLVLLVAGTVWLGVALGGGVLTFLVAFAVGAMLLASAVAVWFAPGDPRLLQLGAFAGLLGAVFGLPLALAVGFATGLGLALLAFAAFAAAGSLAGRELETPDEVPDLAPDAGTHLEVALDEALLGTMVTTLPMPEVGDSARLVAELDEARVLFRDRGWLKDPVAYHRAPLPPEPELREARVRGLRYEHARFESGYQPWEEEPGRERWLSRVANRTAHAWVMRHAEPERPWLVCVHGYQMGMPLVDTAAFDAGRLHRERGLNLLLPVLPLHGPRKTGRISGVGYLGGDFLDTVHAAAQAIWDLRRWVGWIRAQGGRRIGAYGLSLGGYTVSTLAAFEPLERVVAGIPAADFARLVYAHAPADRLREEERAGLEREAVEEVLRVVSPLELEPLVPRSERAIFAGVADRLVPADQVRDLWRHWGRPEIGWYPGAHVGFGRHRAARDLLGRQLAALAEG